MRQLTGLMSSNATYNKNAANSIIGNSSVPVINTAILLYV